MSPANVACGQPPRSDVLKHLPKLDSDLSHVPTAHLFHAVAFTFVQNPRVAATPDEADYIAFRPAWLREKTLEEVYAFLDAHTIIRHAIRSLRLAAKDSRADRDKEAPAVEAQALVSFIDLLPNVQDLELVNVSVELPKAISIPPFQKQLRHLTLSYDRALISPRLYRDVGLLLRCFTAAEVLEVSLDTPLGTSRTFESASVALPLDVAPMPLRADTLEIKGCLYGDDSELLRVLGEHQDLLVGIKRLTLDIGELNSAHRIVPQFVRRFAGTLEELELKALASIFEPDVSNMDMSAFMSLKRLKLSLVVDSKNEEGTMTPCNMSQLCRLVQGCRISSRTNPAFQTLLFSVTFRAIVTGAGCWHDYSGDISELDQTLLAFVEQTRTQGVMFDCSAATNPRPYQQPEEEFVTLDAAQDRLRSLFPRLAERGYIQTKYCS